MTEKNDSILIGRGEIMDFVGIKSDDLFMCFIKQGLPAMLVNGRWYAHKETIDLFFKKASNKSWEKAPEDIYKNGI